MVTNKFSESLQLYLERTPPSEIVVIVELKYDSDQQSTMLSRQEKISNNRNSFSQHIEPVNAVLKRTGGNIIDTVWLNKTIKMEVPVNALHELANLESVEYIDLPHQIKREA